MVRIAVISIILSLIGITILYRLDVLSLDAWRVLGIAICIGSFVLSRIVRRFERSEHNASNLDR